MPTGPTYEETESCLITDALLQFPVLTTGCTITTPLSGETLARLTSPVDHTNCSHDRKTIRHEKARANLD